MDPMADHKARQDAMPDKMRALRDAQMGRTPPPQINWGMDAPPVEQQIPPCPNCGQRHMEGGCPHAMGKSPFPQSGTVD